MEPLNLIFLFLAVWAACLLLFVSLIGIDSMAAGEFVPRPPLGAYFVEGFQPLNRRAALRRYLTPPRARARLDLWAARAAALTAQASSYWPSRLYLQAVETAALRSFTAASEGLRIKAEDAGRAARWTEPDPGFMDPAPRSIRFTYETVTPDSAEYGEREDIGWSDSGGAELTGRSDPGDGFDPPEYQVNPAAPDFCGYLDPAEDGGQLQVLLETAAELLRDLNCTEPNGSGDGFYGPEYTVQSYATGAEIRYGAHLSGFTTAEYDALADLLGAV